MERSASSHFQQTKQAIVQETIKSTLDATDHMIVEWATVKLNESNVSSIHCIDTDTGCKIVTFFNLCFYYHVFFCSVYISFLC